MKVKNKKLESEVATKLKLNQDMAKRLQGIEKEKEKRSSELAELKTNQKTLKTEVDKQAKLNQDFIMEI